MTDRDKLIVRKPVVSDLSDALKDLGTLRSAPPLLLSMAAMVILTGNILYAVLAVVLTSFMHAFWSRLLT